jgi:cell wall-associated NlpC family hydrolase
MRSLRAFARCAVVLFGLAGTAGAATGFAPDRAAEKAALSQIGAPWTWQGTSPKVGFDSPGLVVWAYGQQGIRLPHSTEAIFALKRATRVSLNGLRPGDLVFFEDAGHMGIYVGDGRFIHAPRTGSTVTISKLAGYYTKVFTGAIRIGPLRTGS